MKSLLVVLLFLAFVSEAQITRYSFKVAANYPVVKDITTSDYMTQKPPWYMGTAGSGAISYPGVKVTTRQSFSEHMGIEGGGHLDYVVSKEFFLTTGLTVSYLRFKQIISVENFDTDRELTEIPDPGIDGSPYATVTFRDLDGTFVRQTTASDNLGETTTLYLQAPVLAGMSLLKEKLLLRAGATFSYLLNATVYKAEFSGEGSSIEINEVKNHTRDGYSELLASATVQATYLVTKKIGIDFLANKFLSPIYSNTNQDKKAKYTVLSLGLSYTISK